MKKILKLMMGALVLSIFCIFSVSFLWAGGDKHEKKIEKGHWAAPLEEKNRINTVTDTIESIQRGRNLYTKNCVDCHGHSAEGNGPDAEYLESKPTNLKAMAGHHADGDMAWKIENGRGEMPSWKEIFTDQQTWDIVNFIQSLKEKN